MNRCNRVYGMLGLAAKKGSIVSGGSACERELKNGAGGLVIIAGDAAANTRERYIRLANNRKMDYLVFGACGELGRRIGRGERSVMIVTDRGLAFNICELLGFAAKITGV
jgi:ribosomal protein L7Ae-like RNA K-turn-binding protein